MSVKVNTGTSTGQSVGQSDTSQQSQQSHQSQKSYSSKSPGEIKTKGDNLLNANVFLCSLIAFLLCGVKLGGSGAPAVVAFMAIASPIQGVAAFAGLAAAFFVGGTVSTHIVEITACLVILAIKYTFGIINNRKFSAVWTAAYAGGIYLTCGVVVSIVFTPSLPLLLAIFLRSAICFSLTYFMFEFLTELGRTRQINIAEKSISTAVVYILLICSLANISFGYFNLGRAFCAFVILAVAPRSKTGAGATAGALSAMGLTLTSYDMGRSSIILVCSGLLAGVFSNCGKLSVSIIFIAANLLGTIIIGLPAGSTNFLFDITAGAVLFALIPDVYKKFIADDKPEKINGVLPERLKITAAALREVREIVLKASKALGEGEIGGELINSSLEYLSVFESSYGSIGEYGAIGDLSEYYNDSVKATAITRLLESYGADNIITSAFYDKNGRVFIECCYEKRLNVGMNTIIKKISAILDKDLDSPHITKLEDKTTRIRLHELPPFTIDVGSAGKSGGENSGDNISGDFENYFKDGFGGMYFILSDGMGMGGRAAVESRMTVSLLTSLLKAGFPQTLSIRLTNLLMTSKSTDEIFATIDLVFINLFTGKAQVIKSGAAATLYRSNGIVKTLESRALPSGIISPADFEKFNIQLRSGDGIVMLTDGINDSCFPKIKELILSQGLTAQYIADEIIKYAHENDTPRPDDKTAIAIRVNC